MKLVHRIGIAFIAFGLFVLILNPDSPIPLGGLFTGAGCSLLIFFGNDDGK